MRSHSLWMVPIAGMLMICTALPASAGIAAKTVRIIKVSPRMSAASLARRPDTDRVELSNGRRIRLGDIRRLRKAAARLRASALRSRMPKAFRLRPAATGTRVSRAADLVAALKRSDSDTVVLPSGRRTTVGMIRLLRPEVERRLGHSLTANVRPRSLAGSAIHVTAKTNWKTILRKPDGTVLEAPNGRRITVGQLKQALLETQSGRRLPALKR